MKLHQAQSKVASSNVRFRVWLAGRRTGKTTEAVEELKVESVLDDDRNVLYLAPTLQAARDIVWNDLKKELQPAIIKTNESRLEITVRTVKGGQSTIKLRGWEAIETLRGQKFHFIVLDEVAMYRAFWEGWQEVLLPALTDTGGKALFISTPKGFNHFYDLYTQCERLDDWENFHSTTYENPYITDEAIDELKASTTSIRFAQEYLAEFKKKEGLVYQEFSRGLHLYDTLPEVRTTKYLSLDFGFRHPAALLTIYEDFDGGVWVDEEWYKTGKTDAMIAEYAGSIPDVEAIYPDPENQGGIQELINHQMNVRDVHKGRGSVTSGIDKVRDLLRARKLRINKRCINTIAEFESYSYPEESKGRVMQENPLKENDDAMDSLRYYVMSRSDTKLIERKRVKQVQRRLARNNVDMAR